MGDYSKGLEIWVGNYGYYAEGQLRDRSIVLPKTRAEIDGFLEKAGLHDPLHEETYVSCYESDLFGLDPRIVESANLDELNLLASQLQRANSEDIERVKAWIGFTDKPSSIMELMNMLEQSDDLPVFAYDYEGAQGVDRWGQTCVERMTPQENLGYTIAEQDPDLMRLLNSDSRYMDAFDFGRYGEALEWGDYAAGKEYYADFGMDRPSLDEFDLEYFEAEYSIEAAA